MARLAGPTCEMILTRVREQGGGAVDRDLAMRTLSRAQRMVNAALARVTDEGSFTAIKQKTVYYFREQLPSAVDILSVRRTADGTAILQAQTMEELNAWSSTWWRATGTRIEFWNQQAHDILILCPAHATLGTALTIVYSVLTDALDSFNGSYNAALQLDDADVDIAMMLAEIILLLHTRAYDAAKRQIDNAKIKLGPYLGG